NRPFTVGYVGTVGLWYLFDETLECFNLIREHVPHARLHILNRGEHAYIQMALHNHGFPKEAILLVEVDIHSVTHTMNEMDVGLFFIKPVFSKIASAATKLGEFLGCGVPCLSNEGIGDMTSILVGENVGVAVPDFSVEAMRQGVQRLLVLTCDPEVRQR